MDITIDMIKQLREATAAGMGACKEALKATDGNMDEAVKYLREKGLAVAAKRVDKESKQGIVALAEAADKKSMALAEVNCETDFVANTDSYKDFCKKAAQVALEGKNIEETLMDEYKMLLTKTGENVKIRRSERYELTGAGVLSGYIHMGGKIGVLVELACDKADTAELAKSALADVEIAQKKMGGNVARVRVNQKGLNALAEAIDKAIKEEKSAKSADWLKPLVESIRGATAAVGAMKVSVSGIDFTGSLKAASDSALAKFGKTSLGADHLKFAAKDAVYARAIAPGGTMRSNQPIDEQMKLVFKLIKDIGVDLDKFLAYAVKGDDLRIVGDVKSAIDYFKGAETNGLKAAVMKKAGDKDFMEHLFGEYAEATNKNLAFEPCTQALNLSFAIRGYTGAASLAERFVATLPEAAAKKPFDCAFISYVSVVKAIIPAISESLDEEQRAMAQPLLVQLPKESKGGIASATWREGETFKALCRVSADEIKGIGSLVNVGMSFAMMQAMKGGTGAMGEEDDADDDDDDSDDED